MRVRSHLAEMTLTLAQLKHDVDVGYLYKLPMWELRLTHDTRQSRALAVRNTPEAKAAREEADKAAAVLDLRERQERAARRKR